MKKVVNILVVTMCLLSSGFAKANVKSIFDEDLPKAAKIVNEITKESLKDIVIEKETIVYVTFTVNSDNEMAILDVRSTDKELRQVVKSALNTKVVRDADLVVGKPYTISIKLKQ